MTDKPMPPSEELREIFDRPPPPFIRIVPEGFLIDSQVQEILEVVIQDESITRKLWRSQEVVCRSESGTRARNGKLCKTCKDLRRCTPQLVLWFEYEDQAMRLPLGYTSARNYLAYRKDLEAKGVPIFTAVTRLSVIRRGHWGEVVFHQIL